MTSRIGNIENIFFHSEIVCLLRDDATKFRKKHPTQKSSHIVPECSHELWELKGGNKGIAATKLKLFSKK